MRMMRTLLYCALCITLCAAIGCDEPKEGDGGGNNGQPAITGQPKGATYQLNEDATPLSVTVENVNKPVYQWYANISNSNKGGVALDGATSNTYVPPTDIPGTLYYYCVIGDLTSNTAEIIVGDNTPTGYNINPPTSVTPKGSEVSLQVSPSTGTTFQWYSNKTNSNSSGTIITGATSNTYVPPTDTEGTLYYYCVVDGTASSTAVVTVSKLIVPPFNPQTAYLRSAFLSGDKIVLNYRTATSAANEGTVTLLGIKAASGTTSSDISSTVFEEVGSDTSKRIILFGEQYYADSGFAKSYGSYGYGDDGGVGIQELLLLEGLAVVDDATSNTAADKTDKNKISYRTYQAWKALEVHTPPAGNENTTVNN